MLAAVRIVPNPVKEAVNRRKHGWSFDGVAEIFEHPVLELPDDRLLGYENEARVQLTGRIGQRVVRLVFEPVDVDAVELAVRPVSPRDATRGEEQDYRSLFR
jgi:uncharacterized DUF497 family protein